MNRKYSKEKNGKRVQGVIKKSNQVIFWPLVFVIIGFAILIGIAVYLGFSYYFSIAFLVWLVFLGGYLATNIFIKNKSVSLVTNFRIINFEQYGLFSYRVNEIDLKDIEKIAFKKTGIISNMFDSGSLYLFLKNSKEFLPIDYVYNPKDVAEGMKKLI